MCTHMCSPQTLLDSRTLALPELTRAVKTGGVFSKTQDKITSYREDQLGTSEI